MITFAHPAYLWGLAGLAIPVAIHLLSRREGKVVLVGSVRHLEPSATRQFRTLKLNEMLLLLVRCILYSLIVLWFSGPVFTGWQTRTRAAWVEPSVATSPYTTSLLTQLDGRGFERQPWSQAWDSLTYPDVLKEMLLQPADSVVVIARGNARRFSGPRAVLPAHVQWIHPPQDSGSRFVVRPIATARDSVQIREGITNGERTHFTTEMLTFTSAAARLNSANEVSVRNADTLRIHIAADEKYAEEARL
ncbi:MAG: BatA domain-containing protein, partial [Cyclobacteriaceae bacterium]|nr:BatA domain-containing protein [Cyclobacteriaceae bacterium]